MDPAQIEQTILDLIEASGKRGSISPTDAALALAEGDDAEKTWRRLLPQIRRVAIGLAQAGRIVILRKGKPADPGDFKGVYRLGRTL